VLQIAHIGGIPIEEWLPFVVPVLAIYLYVRRRERRRRAAVQRLLSTGARLDEAMASAILERLRAAQHAQLQAEHVPLLYPPGPDGTTACELAERVALDVAEVEIRLEDLVELGYLERSEGHDAETRVWLTAEGFAAAHIAEDVVLQAFATAPPAHPTPAA
jgi:hypothetical protein